MQFRIRHCIFGSTGCCPEGSSRRSENAISDPNLHLRIRNCNFGSKFGFSDPSVAAFVSEACLFGSELGLSNAKFGSEIGLLGSELSISDPKGAFSNPLTFCAFVFIFLASSGLESLQSPSVPKLNVRRCGCFVLRCNSYDFVFFGRSCGRIA